MVVKRPAFAEFKPWAGLLAGMAGAGLQHQGISDSMHFDCRYGDADMLAGIAALVLIAIGASLSWSAARSHRDPASPRRFVAHMSLMAAVFFAVMVGWQIMAGVILPACLP
jgi:hypothetical protein